MDSSHNNKERKQFYNAFRTTEKEEKQASNCIIAFVFWRTRGHSLKSYDGIDDYGHKWFHELGKYLIKIPFL